jgi:hypothetical protein
MFSHRGVENLSPKLPQCRQRSILVGTHQPRVSDHIGDSDGGKSALDGQFSHLR